MNSGCHNQSGCGCAEQADSSPEVPTAKKQIKIEFLYLDLEVCDPCKSSETNVVVALEDVARIVRATGAEIQLERIHVESLEQALALGFQTSPTVRVNGRDLQLQFSEAHCQTCSELSGTETSCRLWNFAGREHTSLPKEMLIEAILREIYGGTVPASEPPAQMAGVPENIAAFLAAKGQKGVAEQFVA